MPVLVRGSFLAFLLFLSVPVFAQTGNQGFLDGRVLDASGVVVPQAIVTVRNHHRLFFRLEQLEPKEDPAAI